MGRVKGHGLWKTVPVYFLPVIILICLIGCGKEFGPGETEQVLTPKDENLIVVGVSQVGSESMWRTANTESVQSVFTKENGYFLLFDNARQKQENQIKALRSFISQKVDYIVFSPIMENGWDTVLQEAKEADIPVIIMDRMVNVKDDSLYITRVGSDFDAEGRCAGEWLAEYLKKQERAEEPVNIVVLQGTEGSTSMIGRTEGFNAIAEQYENWNILEQVSADYTTAKGHEVMEGLLTQYDDIDVVVSQNDDMTFGALEAIEEAGLTSGIEGDIIIISFDAVKAALKLVQDGIINVDIECNPVLGEEVEKVISALENGEAVDKTYPIEEKVFTIENVGEFIDDRTY